MGTSFLSTVNEIALTFFTFVLALFTYFLWNETKKARLKSITPQISVSFYPETSTFMGLKIENTSSVDAQNVTIACSNKNKYIDNRGKEFFYSEKLSKNISYLPAGQRYLFLVGYYSVMEDEVFEFDISCSDMSDEKNTQFHIEIDMKQLSQTLVEVHTEKEIANNIKELTRNIASLMESGILGKGLRVYPYSIEDRKLKKLEQDNDFYRGQVEDMEARKSKD